MQLTCLSDDYAVARAGPACPVPSGVLDGAGFSSVSRTDEELSVVARTSAVMAAGSVHEDLFQEVETGWSVFKVHGPFAFDETGIVAALSRTLAGAGIGIFVISTYDTDYILVKETDAGAAAAAWRADGHEVAA